MRSNQAELQALLEIMLLQQRVSNIRFSRSLTNRNYRRKREKVDEKLFRLWLYGDQRYSIPDILRKEVIQPQVLLRLPCYDFTPVINRSLDACLPKVGSAASAPVNSHGVTGGVYKARERIHRGVLIRDY